MHWQLSLVAVLCVGCSTIVSEVDPKLTAVAGDVISAKDEGRGAQAPHSAQPNPYAAILQRNFAEMQYRFDTNLRTEARQGRYPQLRPGASARLDGDVIANVGVRQVLYDGGLYEAAFHDADVKAIGRQIDLLITVSDKASDDMVDYLNYRKNKELEATFTQLSHHLEKLLALAETRMNGGIGAYDEVVLFQLKLSEIMTEAQIAQSNAAVDVAALKDIDVSLAPAPFSFSQDHLPLSVMSALAAQYEARSAVQLAKRQSRPTLSLDADANYNLNTGTPGTGVGLTIDAAPVRFGGDVAVMEAEQALYVARQELNETVAEVRREQERLEMQIAALRLQATQTTELADKTQLRLAQFAGRFQAGSANLTEAAGIVDTLRRTLESQISVRYRILDLERQLAELTGAFWSFSADNPA